MIKKIKDILFWIKCEWSENKAVAAWKVLMLPFMLSFGFLFFLFLIAYHLSTEPAKQFLKELFDA